MECVGDMDYDYLSSIVSDYSNLSSLTNTNKSANLLNGITSLTNKTTGTVGDISSLSDAVSLVKNGGSFSNILSSVLNSKGVDEDTAEKLQDVASAKTTTGLESEARSELLMQNYLQAALMKDTLQNSLTDSADFTSSLFQNLAVGTNSDDNSSNNSTLGTLQNSTLNAISALSSYQNFLDSESQDEDNGLDSNFSDLLIKYGLDRVSGTSA